MRKHREFSKAFYRLLLGEEKPNQRVWGHGLEVHKYSPRKVTKTGRKPLELVTRPSPNSCLLDVFLMGWSGRSSGVSGPDWFGFWLVKMSRGEGRWLELSLNLELSQFWRKIGFWGHLSLQSSLPDVRICESQRSPCSMILWSVSSPPHSLLMVTLWLKY